MTLALVRRIKEISVEPFEPTINLLFRHNLLNPVDRCTVAFGRQTCAFFAMILLKIVKSIIQRSAQVRGGACSNTVANRTVVQNDHAPPRSGQSISDRKPGNAGTEDANI